MPYQSKVIVLQDNSAQIGAEYAREAAELRRETAWRILTSAQQNAPKSTEALSVSIYVSDEFGSGYAAAVSAALDKNPDAPIVPEVPAERDATIIAWVVGYAETAEFYTGPMNPGAHPYFTPAIEAERPGWEADVAKLGSGA